MFNVWPLIVSRAPLWTKPNVFKSFKGQRSYAGLLVSNKVRRIWMTLTIADSFFSLSKILDSSCSTVSCLLTPDKEKERKMGLLTVPSGSYQPSDLRQPQTTALW